MASAEPHEEAPDSPEKPETAPDEARPHDDEAESLKSQDEMTLEEFLEDVYYNPYGPPPQTE